MSLQQRTTAGRALIEGIVVAQHVTLIEQYEPRFADTGHSGYKDVSIEHQPFVVFEAVDSLEFRERLQRLADSVAASVDERRRLRDRGENAVAFDLVLDDGRSFRASASGPFEMYRQVEHVAFPVGLGAQ